MSSMIGHWDQRKMMRLLLTGIVVSGLSISPASAQRHDDFVTSGRSKGSWKINIGSSRSGNMEVIGNPVYLMKNIPMHSTTVPFERQIISFGPFYNKSDNSLVVTLTHIGGGKKHVSVGIVNEMEVTRSESVSTFTVPPRSSYGWQALNEHSITALVFANNVKFQHVGLPYPEDFMSPKKVSKYLGCVNHYYLSEGSGEYELDETRYYYEDGLMSDGSNTWTGPVFAASFFGGSLRGPAPDGDPGRCLMDLI